MDTNNRIIEELRRKHFLYQDIEVILTGRTAEKVTTRRTHILFEIRPRENADGSWKKWVRLDELWVIHPAAYPVDTSSLLEAVRAVVAKNKQEQKHNE